MKYDLQSIPPYMADSTVRSFRLAGYTNQIVCCLSSRPTARMVFVGGGVAYAPLFAGSGWLCSPTINHDQDPAKSSRI
jgi:hypothetical protein